MCFSAEASFTLSAGLAVVGVVTIRSRTSQQDIPVLSIPLIFAAQQFTEGLLWVEIGAGNTGVLRSLSTHGFLIFAQVVWPALVAPALYFIEPDSSRKRAIKWLIPYGCLIAALLLLRMIIWPYHAEIAGHSIRYVSDFRISEWLVLFYAVAVVTPLLLSSRKILAYFGGAVIAVFALTQVFFAQALISVWCFFAAVLSGSIYWYARNTAQQSHRVQSPGL